MTKYRVEIVTHEVYIVDAASSTDAEAIAQDYWSSEDGDKHRLPDNDEDPSKCGFWWETKVYRVYE